VAFNSASLTQPTSSTDLFSNTASSLPMAPYE
jgi:hypothetical protein